MSFEVIETTNAPAPGGAYSQAVKGGGLVSFSGQVGLEPDSGALADGVAAQTRQALKNLDAVLKAAHVSKGDVIKTTCFLTDIANFAEFNKEYEDFFGPYKPARSTVGVGLAGSYLIEIEAFAIVPETQP
ncbi:Rid family detoxifying hydrolase [Salinibacterium sp. TMP30]|uniref:RidA family protein n=1 Tax=Salinibacterium sp. TMP30 TaxID=3138237 RepID=UPI00313889F8